MPRQPKVRAELVEGVYEHLVTGRLDAELARTSLRALIERIEDDAPDAHQVLAGHVATELRRALATLPREERVERGREIVARVLEVIAGLVSDDVAESVRDEVPLAPARRLLSVHRAEPPPRPATPFATSTLLTRNRAEPSFGHELGREVASADRIDAIIAFVTVGGVRAIVDELQRFARREGARLRLLTTTFTGTTEIAALDLVARLPGAAVKVSFDTRRTRLHAKAWLFHRASGLSTAYVGSANLTATALGSGQEWMVKVCAADLPHVIEKFEGTFETLWSDPEFEAYCPDSADDRARVERALGAETSAVPDTFLVQLHALPFQQQILDRLAAERQVHGRRRNLVVAATGTGKTVIAALDYANQAAATGVPPRLLFLAHRAELLEQARRTFRFALQDASFGELLVGDERPTRWEHVFASIQSAVSAGILERFGPAYFRHVVVDECHHVPARSYQALVPALEPDLLVGLTATPERRDSRSLLPDFDDHIAAELRLWHALDAQLLVPFEYYGVSDDVDLRRVRWSRSGYDEAELANLYTGNDARAALILRQLSRRVSDLRSIRALGFCVSVAHAEFMAARCTAAGIPALAVHGTSANRDDAPRQLRDRQVNILFTCDLYNEGVDLPFVDTLLFLRPTQSATLFLQQLGRGLRHFPARATSDQARKRSCLVLDFIGQHRDEFRFDTVLGALTGIPRAQLRKAVEDGFPYLPSGCSVRLDEVAREQILAGLRATLAGARRLAAEVRELSHERPPSLAEFLAASGRDLDDVYDAGGWSAVRRAAGVLTVGDAEDGREVDDLSRRLGWLQHVDEPARLRVYREAGRGAATEVDRRRLVMLDAQLHHRGVLRAADEVAAYLAARPTITDELDQLGEVLADRIELPQDLCPVPEWPLSLHRHYTRREIAVAVGFVRPGDKNKALQGGILQLASQRRELLFVTLDKSGKGFSPTTRYRDYALSPNAFHWETQAAASVTRPSGRRYLESPSNGWSFYLFVRAAPGDAFAFLGAIRYAGHQGDRPIAITWHLDHPLPASLYERYATLRPP